MKLDSRSMPGENLHKLSLGLFFNIWNALKVPKLLIQSFFLSAVVE